MGSKVLGKRLILLSVVFIVLLCCTLAVHGTNNTSIQSGNLYAAALESIQATSNWAAIAITHNGVDVTESSTPFISLALTNPTISDTIFPGANHKDGIHYYAATLSPEFNVTRVQNVTFADLASEGLFPSGNFTQFYPGYTNVSDNPNITFGTGVGTYVNVTLSGDNYTALQITLGQNVDYYLLKYNTTGGITTPLFLSKNEDAICYDGDACVSQFLLPISSTESWNFYSVSERTPITFRIWIDGVETTTMAQTAQPYNITVQALDLFTNDPLPNTTIAIGEYEGQNIFIPYRFSGYVSEAYTLGTADANGTEYFIAAPTVYPTISGYSMFVAAVLDGTFTAVTNLTITNKDAIVFSSKPVTPSLLSDQVKVAVNAMNQINSFLFRWASQILQAKRFTVSYFTATNTTVISDLVTGGSNMTLKTGAPNVITITVFDGFTPNTNYFIRFQEDEGYLVLNPYTGSSPLDLKNRTHANLIPVSNTFTITPTSLGSLQGNISIDIVNPSLQTVYTIYPYADTDLNIVTGGTFHNDDLMKTIVNTMNSVISSNRYAVNE